MDYKIFENGAHINTIVADESFIIPYCTEHGYTYELVKQDVPQETILTPELLSAQIQSISDRQEFIEDRIAEMAMQVYSEIPGE